MLHLLSWATHTKIICRDKQQHSVEGKHEDWINVSSKGQLTLCAGLKVHSWCDESASSIP